MHQIQRPISTIVADIRRTISDSGLTQTEYASAANVDQATISRILNQSHSPTRLSSGIKKICKYAKIPTTQNIEKDISHQSMLLEALEAAWDGTDKHARALTRLLNEIVRISANK